MIDNKTVFSSRKIATINEKLFFNDLSSFTLFSINLETGEKEPLLYSAGKSYYRSIYDCDNKLLLFSSVGKDFCKYNYKDHTICIIDIPSEMVDGNNWNWSADYIDKNGKLFFHWVDNLVIIYDVLNNIWERVKISGLEKKNTLNCYGFSDDKNVFFPIEFDKKIICLSLIDYSYFMIELKNLHKGEIIRSTYYYRDVLWILTQDGNKEKFYRCDDVIHGECCEISQISFDIEERIQYYSIIGISDDIWLIPTITGKVIRYNIVKDEIIQRVNDDIILDSGIMFTGETEEFSYLKPSSEECLYIVSKANGQIRKLNLWIKQSNIRKWYEMCSQQEIVREELWNLKDLINIINC